MIMSSSDNYKTLLENISDKIGYFERIYFQVSICHIGFIVKVENGYSNNP